MRIILFTQEDPFYLADSTKDLIYKINRKTDHNLIHAIITSPSPFGKSESFFKKSLKTLRIFGYKFFIFYSLKFLIRKFILKKSVEKAFKDANIPVLKIKDSINSKHNIDFVKKLNADLILIIAGNQIIKSDILNSTKYGVFNVHSSLLPNYRGLMPTFWVLKNCESQTGVTLYKLTEGVDNGPIISSKKIMLDQDITQANLIKKLKILANDLIVQDISKIKDQRNYKKQQNGTYFNFPKPKDVQEFKLVKKKFF